MRKDLKKVRVMETAREIAQAGVWVPRISCGILPGMFARSKDVSVSPSFNLTVATASSFRGDAPQPLLSATLCVFCLLPQGFWGAEVQRASGGFELAGVMAPWGTLEQGGQEVLGKCSSLPSSGSFKSPGRLSSCCP